MNNTYIKDLDCYIPSKKLFFEDHKSYFKSDENNSIFESYEEFKKFADSINLKSVNVEEKQDIKQMVYHLLDRSISENKLDLETIDYILVATDIDDQFKWIGQHILYRYKLKDTKVLRVSENFCTNVDLSIQLAEYILSEPEIENVMIITGSMLEENLIKRIISTYAVVGDSVGYMILSKQKNTNASSLLLLDQKTICTGDLLRGEDFDLKTLKDNTFIHFQGYLKCLTSLLESNGVDDSDIQTIILHNANHYLLEEILKSKKIDLNKIDKRFVNSYGHLGTTDIILNLKPYLETNIEKGKTILALNSSVSGTYSSSLFKTV